MNKPNGKRRAVRAFFLLAVSLTTAVICAFGLMRERYIRSKSRAYYASLDTTILPKTTASPSTPPTATPTDAVSSADDSEDDELHIMETLIPLDEYIEPIETPAVDFEFLREMIPDITAWIYCEGTGIDYPVVQGTDNEYYLDHLPDGSKNKLGSIFVDYRNSADFTDGNSIIYGHHIKSGGMFGLLEHYKEQEYYDEHPVMTLYTPVCTYKIEFIAGYVVDAARESLPRDFADIEEFENYIEEVRLRTVFNSEVTASAGDKLLALCTCTYTFKGARLVLVGKLTEMDLSAPIHGP